MAERIKEKVSLEQARERLVAFGKEHPGRYFTASTLADVIWPGNWFNSPQGAARAASGILKRLDVYKVPWRRDGPYGFRPDLLRFKPTEDKESPTS